MIKNFEDLRQVVTEASELFTETHQSCDFEVTQAENGSCTLVEKNSGKKFVFMLAKLGNELKLGFAFYEANEKQPDWIDDVLANGSTSASISQLIESEFI